MHISYKLLLLIKYIFTSTQDDRNEMIRLALKHEKDAMAKEDEFMAEHLRREGYRVTKL